MWYPSKYLKGRADQLTQSDYTIHRARNFLRTITPILAQDKDPNFIYRLT